MDAIFDALKEWGCEIEETLERFLGDEALYAACLKEVTSEEAFEMLGAALEAGQITEAFDYAHTLKGVLANLGLIPMLRITERIVEPLRGGSGENLYPEYEKLLESNEYLKSILGISEN